MNGNFCDKNESKKSKFLEMDKWVGKLILVKMLISDNSIIETEADWFGVGS